MAKSDLIPEQSSSEALQVAINAAHYKITINSKANTAVSTQHKTELKNFANTVTQLNEENIDNARQERNTIIEHLKNDKGNVFLNLTQGQMDDVGSYLVLLEMNQILDAQQTAVVNEHNAYTTAVDIIGNAIGVVESTSCLFP